MVVTRVLVSAKVPAIGDTRVPVVTRVPVCGDKGIVSREEHRLYLCHEECCHLPLQTLHPFPRDGRQHRVEDVAVDRQRFHPARSHRCHDDHPHRTLQVPLLQGL